MTPKEQLAFVDSYAKNVAYAPREYVADFISRFAAGEDVPCCEHYTSIMDALGIWHEAIKFALNQEVTA